MNSDLDAIKRLLRVVEALALTLQLYKESGNQPMIFRSQSFRRIKISRWWLCRNLSSGQIISQIPTLNFWFSLMRYSYNLKKNKDFKKLKIVQLYINKQE